MKGNLWKIVGDLHKRNHMIRLTKTTICWGSYKEGHKTFNCERGMVTVFFDEYYSLLCEVLYLK